MAASRGLSLALGLALAAPVAAYAYDGASKPIHHHHRPAFHRAVAFAGAPAAAAPMLGIWSPSYAPTHEQYEIEGLSRNTDDCVKYGCIGAN